MSNTRHLQLLVVAALVLNILSIAKGQDRRSDVAGRAPSRLSHAESLSQAFRDAANKVLPSVVKIRTESRARGDMATMLRGFGLRGLPLQVPQQRGLGSGMVIDSAGIVLTNNHVVEGADEIVVELSDGTELYATDFTTDPLSDLAIVRVQSPHPLPATRFGDSDALQIGDWVLAVGHPLELETSVSAGIISAKGRSLSRVERASFLQTDAAINPGNSGGPLVNLRGEVVGINTAIASQTGGYQGIGFAIPGNLARDVANQLKQQGQVKRAALGVAIQELTGELAKQLADGEPLTGVLVSQVFPRTPAERAGIEAGDVITHFAGRPVVTRLQLQRVVERVEVGSIQTVRLVRFGQPITKRVTTQELAASRNGRGAYRRLRQPRGGDETLGMSVEDISEVARQLGVETDEDGVIVISVDPNGLAAEEGIRQGMLILRVKNTPVQTVAQFRLALQDESLERGIVLLVRQPREDAPPLDRFVVLKSHS